LVGSARVLVAAANAAQLPYVPDTNDARRNETRVAHRPNRIDIQDMLITSIPVVHRERKPNARYGGLQRRAVGDLHVDGELAAVVAEDQDADGAAARLESLLETGPQVGLLDDGEAGLDVTRLGHGNNIALLDVENAVLLEDGAEHGLDDDARGRVRDEGRLLLELLGEEVDTKVAVLAGGSRGRDADDLAGAALENEEVAEADVVAGDGDGVGRVARRGRARDVAHILACAVAFVSARNLVSVHVMAKKEVVTLSVETSHCVVGGVGVGAFVGVLDDGEGALFDSGLLVDCQSTVVVVGVVVVVGGRVRVVVVVVVRRRRRGRARVVVVVRAVGSDGGYGRDGLVVVVVAVAVAAKGGEGTEAFTERSVVVMVVAVLVDLYVNLEVVVVGRTMLAWRSTGTAVTLFFLTCVTDLFFFFFPTWRWHDGKGRRVLTFPSGILKLWAVEIDRDLRVLVGVGSFARLGLTFPVGGWEDAEGDRDASLEVQIGDWGGFLLTGSKEGP
jgi:hypothetical protein